MSEFLESLPEGLREAPFLSKAESIEDAMAQLTNAAGHMGNSLRIPGPEASEEDVTTFQGKVMAKYPQLMLSPEHADDDGRAALMHSLGLPKEAGLYKVEEGFAIEGEDLGALKNRALEMGLTQKQFKNWSEQIANEQATIRESGETAKAEAQELLKGKWGAAHDQRLAQIAKLAEDTEAPDIIKAMIADGALDVEAAEWLFTMNEQLGVGEAAELDAQGKGNPTVIMTPDEAQEQLHEIEVKLYAPGVLPAEKERLSKKRLELMASAYPELTGQSVAPTYVES
jgi:hypothetical protein